jgi:hypothetical protein
LGEKFPYYGHHIKKPKKEKNTNFLPFFEKKILQLVEIWGKIIIIITKLTVIFFLANFSQIFTWKI